MQIVKQFVLMFAGVMLITAAHGADDPVGCDAAGFRQLDFWVGEWAVFNQQDEEVASSRIESVANGCAIIEHYAANTGYSGTSLNLYDAEVQSWRQLWRDSTGDTIDFTGQFNAGAMEFNATGFNDQRGEFVRRMRVSELDDGNVSQISHRTYDDGESWILEYHFTYIASTP